MNRYKCQVCGHVYDPAKGEPSQNIPPGIAFEDLSADWRCPICTAEKDRFKELK